MIRDIFRSTSNYISHLVGTPKAFIIALLIIIVWLLSGPLFNYSNTWQLIINTTTTIITFLMVFLIQNTQNREAKATQIKLDELIRVISKARKSMVTIEYQEDEEIDKVADEFRNLSEKNPTKKL